MKDKLYRTWSLKVKPGDKHFRTRRFFWRMRFALFPFRKTVNHKDDEPGAIFVKIEDEEDPKK